MNSKEFVVLFSFLLVIVLVYSFNIFQPVAGQIAGWKVYSDPGHKFNFSYPQDWLIQNSRHDSVTGSSEVILAKPNSTRTELSILYNPNDALLINSKTGKPIVVSKGLTTLEKQISLDYIFFNATGKFPHKYTIQNHRTASDLAEFERNEGKPGKMLIVFSKMNDKDSCTVIYSDSKRLFYKNLSDVSEIIKSIQLMS